MKTILPLIAILVLTSCSDKVYTYRKKVTAVAPVATIQAKHHEEVITASASEDDKMILAKVIEEEPNTHSKLVKGEQPAKTQFQGFKTKAKNSIILSSLKKSLFHLPSLSPAKEQDSLAPKSFPASPRNLIIVGLILILIGIILSIFIGKLGSLVGVVGSILLLVGLILYLLSIL